MLTNNSILSPLSLSDKEDIYPTDSYVKIHPCLDLFRILLRCTLLGAFVEDDFAGFFFFFPSDLLSLRDNWDRYIATGALLISFY